MKPLIALCGRMASGKSLVRSVWSHMVFDALFLDADAVVHRLYQEDHELIDAICKCFGTSVLMPNGAVDVMRLKPLLSSDLGAWSQLESLVHPRVRQYVGNIRMKTHKRYVVLELALVKKGHRNAYDQVVYVHADRELRYDRAQQKGQSKGWVESIDYKQDRECIGLQDADWCVYNQRSLCFLRRETIRVCAQVHRRIR